MTKRKHQLTAVAGDKAAGNGDDKPLAKSPEESPLVKKLRTELSDAKARMQEMEQELQELREYKEEKENQSESEDEEEEEGLTEQFSCCKHIDPSGSINECSATPSSELYCTQCEDPRPLSYGDFTEVGIYWWRCENCIWQNGCQYEMLCGECADRRSNPWKCNDCGDSEKHVDLEEYEGDQLCENCKNERIEDAKPKCEWCDEKEEDVGPLKVHGKDKEKLCVSCVKEYDEEQEGEEDAAKAPAPAPEKEEKKEESK